MTIVLRARPDWYDSAACRDLGPSIFYTDEYGRGYANSQRIKRAKAVCEGCSVKAACLAASIDETYGIWAGTTPLERRHMRNERGRLPSGQRPADCGTSAGYQRHRRAGEAACAECLAAHALAKAARKNGGTLPDKPAVVNHPEMIGPAVRWRVA